MDIIGSLFKGRINKAINSQLAMQFASEYSKALESVVAFMNTGLPTINPDNADYYQTFKTIGAVYEVTDLISKKYIGSTIVMYKVKDAKKLKQSKAIEKSDPINSYLLKLQAIEEIDNSGLLAVLNNPNPYQTGTQFLWTVVLSYLLSGNTFLHGNFVDGKARELYCFPNMTIVGDPEDLLDPIRGYILEKTNQRKFEKEDIYHVKTGTPAPVNRTFEYLYGVSPLRAYLEPLRTISESKKQSSKQAKNGGTFGILSPKDKEDQLSTDQKKQLHEKMSAARRSDDEMARVFASSIALSWQSIGLPIGDLKLLELVSADEESIYRAYHVPLQFHNQKASTSNNQASAVKQLVYDAVAPVCVALGDAFTRFIGKGYGDVIIEFDYTQLPEMAVNMAEVAKYLIPLVDAGIISRDDARRALRYGETDLDYMKAYYTSGTLTKIEDAFKGMTNITS